MYKVLIIKDYDHRFWVDDQNDEFCDFCLALNFAVKSGFSYEIYRDYWYIGAVKLVARSECTLWRR